MSQAGNALTERLDELRGRIRRALFVWGFSSLTAAVLGAVFLAGFTDWLFHWDDPGVRAIFGLSIAGLAGWIIYRRLYRPLAVELTDRKLAQRVEQRYPGFRDALASTVEFAEAECDPRFGSPDLQKAVVRSTLQAARHLDFRDVVDTTAIRNATAVAAGVCLLLGTVVVTSPGASMLAVRRLVMPFGAPAWPRTVHWQLLTPELEPIDLSDSKPLRIAKGESLSFFAQNANGRLPQRVEMELRTADRQSREPMRPAPQRDSLGQARELATGKIIPTTDEFEFRVVGGDDATVWQKVLVIPAPNVAELNVTLVPPAYTLRSGREIEQLPPNVGNIEALVGTTVQFSARLSKPVSVANLIVNNASPIPAVIAGDGQTFTASFRIEQPGFGSYRFQLVDREGFENTDPPRYELRGVADQPPEVVMNLPANDLVVTSNAVIDVKGSIRDDLGLIAVRLQYTVGRVGDDMADATRPVQTIPLLADQAPAGGPIAPGADANNTAANELDLLPVAFEAGHQWTLADLNLESGMRVIFYLEAVDSGNQVSRGARRTLTFASSEEKGRELAMRQLDLAADIERAHKLQQQARRQVGDLSTQLEQAGELRQQDVDTLQRVELSQRQIEAQLTNPSDGLAQRAGQLVQEFEANQLNDGESGARFQRMAEELQRLIRDHLPPIQDDLTEARKTAQNQLETNSGAQSGDPNPTPRNNPSKNASPRKSSPETNSSNNSGNQNPENADAENSGADNPSGKNPPPEKSPEAKSAQAKSAEAKSTQDKSTQDKSNQDKSAEKGASKAGEKTAATPPPDSANEGDSNAKTPDSGSQPAPTDPSQQLTLQRIDRNQKAVEDSLGEMVAELNRWRNERDVADELSQIRAEQEEVARETAEAAQQTLGQTRQELTPQQRADISKLAGRQQSQADRIDKLAEKLRNLIAERDQRDADAAENSDSGSGDSQTRDSRSPPGPGGKGAETGRQSGENSPSGQESGEQTPSSENPPSNENPPGQDQPGEQDQPGQNQPRQDSPAQDSQGKDQSGQEQPSPDPDELRTAEQAAAEELQRLLREASRELENSRISNDMRNAAAQLENNRTGEASQLQQQAREKIASLEKLLKEGRKTNTQELVERMQKLEEELQKLQEEQKELMQKLQEAAENPDEESAAGQMSRIKRQMQGLQQKMSRLQRQLERLRIREPQEAIEDAIARLEQAQQEIDDGNLEEAAKQQQESLDDLEDAEQQLADRRQEAQERLADEQLARIADELRGMIGRQQTLIDEAKRLEKIQKDRGSLGRAQLKTLRDLSDTQRSLKVETERLVEKLSAAQTFALALKGAARSMGLAADRLADRDPSAATQRLQAAAQQRFIDLVSTLDEKQREQAGGGGGGGQGGGQGGGGASGGGGDDGIPILAELKMLRNLQQELFVRTREVQLRRGADGRMSDADRKELDDLVQLQLEVADLTREMTEVAAEDDEADRSDDEAMPGQSRRQPAPGDASPPERLPEFTDDQPRDRVAPPPGRNGGDDPLPEVLP
jgi:hypothetical protein